MSSKLQLVIDMYDYKMKNDRSLWRLLIASKDKQLESKEQRIQELLLKKAATKGFSFDMMEDFPSVQQIQQRYRTLVQEDLQDLVDCLSELHEETVVKTSLAKMIQECFDRSYQTFVETEAQMIQPVLKNVGFSQDNTILQNSFASWCRKNFKQATIYNQLKKTIEESSQAYQRLYVLSETPSLKLKLEDLVKVSCSVCWWMQCSANKLRLVTAAHPISYPSLMGLDSQLLLPAGNIME